MLLLFGLVFTGFTAMAQRGTVSGTVTDASDGSPLPGVTVLVKGTTIGTATDVNGKYSLEIEPGTTLVFSFVGYTSKEVTANPNTTVDVSLEMTAEFLEEFVVIGYGVQKKADATGSVAAVDSKDFNRGAITAPTELIAGKVAGVQITSGGGAPGEGATIRIRGGSSLSASNDPLIVVDGVPLDNEGVAGMRNPLNTINPNDIETFTVLKDASATAIYGSRASNGVILITTKSGAASKEEKSIHLEYNGTFSLYTPTKKLDVLGADEFRSIINERYADNEAITGMLGDASTDWQSEIYKNAFGMDHYLGASGNYKFLPYRVSAGYTDQDGILKGDNLKRTTLAANLTPSFFDDHLKVTLNARGMFIDNTFADRGAIGAAIQMDPTKPVKDPDSPYGGYWAWTQPNGDPVAQATANPVALLEMRDDISNVKRFIGNARFDYKFHFLPELRANLNMAMDNSKTDGSVFVPENAAFAYDAQKGGGVDRVYDQTKKNELLDFYLNYVREVSSINSRFDLMGGYSWQHYYREGTTFETNVARTDTVTNSDYATESYLVSFFGRFNYAFKDRYLLTFTLRNDGTSRFSPDTRWGLFPSMAFAWKINEEPWMANATPLSQLKLRAGYGVTGQQNIGQGDYPYLARYTYSEPNAAYLLGDYIITLRPEGYDENIKWEETTTWNLGLDYGFLDDRIYGALDFYFRETKDLINFIPVPAGSNLTNYILTNVGNLENRGVEFSITSRPVVKEDLNWYLTLNASYNENKITKLTASDDPNYLGVLVGGISGGVGNTVQIHSVGHPANSFFVYEQVFDADGNPIEGLYVDRNGDGEITDADRYHYKKPAADVWFGISSSIQYKDWDFSFSGRANFGNYVYNNVLSENAVYERLYRPEGPYLGNVLADVTEIGFVTPQYLSNYFVQDGSFFRMDNIALAYNFRDIISAKTQLRLSFTVNNAFVITRYKGLDPEVSDGIDNRIYPRPRVYALGVNFTF